MIGSFGGGTKVSNLIFGVHDSIMVGKDLDVCDEWLSYIKRDLAERTESVVRFTAFSNTFVRNAEVSDAIFAALPAV